MLKKWFAKIKEFFNKLGKKLSKLFKRTKKSVMSHKLATLTVMQLKDKWNMSSYTRKRDVVFKVISRILIFAVATAFMYLIMYLSVAKLGIFFSSKIPVTAMVVLILVLTLFEGISILIGLTRSLYFSKDNSVLITYPVKADYLFLSKVFVYYIDALKKSCALLLPTIFAFGLIYGYSVFYFLWVILLMFIYIAFIVLVCGLLSIPTYFVMKFLKKYRIFQGIFAAVVLGFVIWGSIALINVIPENINLIKTYAKFSLSINNFLKWFSNTFKVSAAITSMFCGVRNGVSLKVLSWYSLIVPVCLIAAIALLTFVNMKFSKPFYTKMISNTNQTSSNNEKDRENKKHSKYHSVYLYELLRIVRDEKYLISSIVTIVVTPLIMLLVNKFYGSFKTQIRGDQFITLFNLLFIMILTMSHNITSSYIYSKDGPSWNINKTIPIDPRKSLTGRLFYNLFISILVIVPSSIIFLVTDKISIGEGIFFVLTLFMLSTFHSILSASFDFMHSKEKTKADIGSEIIHSHETISLIFSLIIALISFGFAFIMYYTSTDHVFLRIFVMSTLVLSLEIYLFFKRIKATYQEN